MAPWDGYRAQRQRKPPGRNNNHNSAMQTTTITPTLNTRIRNYVKDTGTSSDEPAFVKEREIPTSDEILPPLDGGSFMIQINRVADRWESKEQYLSDHYAILREDGVSPLRAAVEELRLHPHILEKDSKDNAQIYEKVD